jgi:hypothetical protein
VVVHSSSVLGSPRGENRGLFLVFKVEFTFLFDFFLKKCDEDSGSDYKNYDDYKHIDLQ